jgi:hypothetical protein
MSNISATDLLETPVPLPPIELQERFEQAFQGASQAREVLCRAEERGNHLLHSLTQRAFRGEI